MSCRLDTLADTTFSCVCDMTKDMSPTCRRDTRHVFKRRLGKTFQKKTFPAKQNPGSGRYEIVGEERSLYEVLVWEAFPHVL